MIQGCKSPYRQFARETKLCPMVPDLELASFHPPGAYNFEMIPRFWKNLCTPEVICITVALALAPRAVRLLINTPRVRGTIECRMLLPLSVGTEMELLPCRRMLIIWSKKSFHILSNRSLCLSYHSTLYNLS